jgi:signal transduction histidine kinase/DNA-binding beta-propeller fold protein YncE
MNNDSPARGPDGDGLDSTRETMRRDLNRANTTVGIILMVVLGLAIAAVLAGIRAARSFERAEIAEASSTDRLWNSYVAQARAVRLTPEAGRREAVFNVIRNAAIIRKNAALRSEAIASLALSDIESEQPLQPIPKDVEQVELDSSLEHYAYGGATGDVFVCSMKDGTVRQTLQAQSLGAGTRQSVRSVVFSPDGSKLAARFSGGAMVIWDLSTGQRLLTSGVAATNLLIAGISFWPDTDKISFGDADAQGQITIFDFAAKARVGTAIRVGTHPFRFRPGTTEVAIASDNHVDLLRYPDEITLQTLNTTTRIYALAWSPDGTRLAVSTEDGDICLWDVVRGTQSIFRGHSEPCVRLTFSPDGKLLASGSRDGTTRFWDVAQGQTLVVATEGLAGVFSRDGQRVGFCKPSGGYGIWRLSSSESYDLLVCPKSEGAFLSVDLSPSGRWCIATQSKGVRIWDLKNNSRETFIPGTELQSARITPDESALYVCRHQGLERWPFQTTEAGVKIDPTATQVIAMPAGEGARAIALSLEGNRALVELSDLRLAVLNLTTDAPPVFLPESSRQPSLRTPGSPTGAGRFAISPDGRWAVTGFGVGKEDHPMVWDAQTGKLVTTLPFGSAVVAFSPDGRLLGAAGTAAFAIWSVDGWQLLNRFDRAEAGVSHGSLAFMRDRNEIAVTRTRQFAQLRNALTNEAYADLIAPQLQSVNSIRMSLDGAVLVTASATDKLQVWHLDRLRNKLAPLHLDWRAPQPNTPEAAGVKPDRSSPVLALLIASLAGFCLAALFALAGLRRHREAIAGYLAAETRAAGRNREFEVAKVELMHGQKMQALGTLAAGIAHDFNNLLSVIRMSNKLIGRETKTNADIQENVADIEQAVMQGKNVVGSMLGYARTENALAGPTDISSVVEDTVSLLSREFLSGIALTLELDREAPKVKVSRGRLEQILLNLIVNASEAMQGNGKLKITSHRRSAMPTRLYALRPTAANSFVEMTVADSGSGIAPEHQLRLFEPFFTTKRAGAKAGTGLGLSLVYSIAQQDGLGLSVESQPHLGATFTIVVPVLADTTPVRETHTFPIPNPP